MSPSPGDALRGAVLSAVRTAPEVALYTAHAVFNVPVPEIAHILASVTGEVAGEALERSRQLDLERQYEHERELEEQAKDLWDLEQRIERTREVSRQDELRRDVGADRRAELEGERKDAANREFSRTEALRAQLAREAQRERDADRSDSESRRLADERQKAAEVEITRSKEAIERVNGQERGAQEQRVRHDRIQREIRDVMQRAAERSHRESDQARQQAVLLVEMRRQSELMHAQLRTSLQGREDLNDAQRKLLERLTQLEQERQRQLMAEELARQRPSGGG